MESPFSIWGVHILVNVVQWSMDPLVAKKAWWYIKKTTYTPCFMMFWEIALAMLLHITVTRSYEIPTTNLLSSDTAFWLLKLWHMYSDSPTAYGLSNTLLNFDSDDTGMSGTWLCLLQACTIDWDRIRHVLCNYSVRVSVVSAFAPCKIHHMKTISSPGTPESSQPTSAPVKDHGLSFLDRSTACLIILEHRNIVFISRLMYLSSIAWSIAERGEDEKEE